MSDDKKTKGLTEAENKILKEDVSVPEGYMKMSEGFEKSEAPKGEEGSEAKKDEGKEKAVGETGEEKPKEEKSKVKSDRKDFFERLETEIAKPEGKENLSEFTPREKAYFHQMRSDRKKRQKAEEERDAALFREAKDKKQEAKSEDEGEEADEDVFKGKEDDDLLTVKETKALLKKLKSEKKEKPQGPDKARIQYLKLCEKDSREKHKDFDTTMALAPDLLEGNKEALTELGRLVEDGESPSEAMYTVIQKQPDFEKLLPAAEVRIKARSKKTEAKAEAEKKEKTEPDIDPEDAEKEAKAKQAQDELEKNSGKSKTTAHISAGEDGAAGEVTLDDIVRMSDTEFARLPKKTREKILKEMGTIPPSSR